MAIAKVILNGETLMDVTSDTAAAGSMLSGTTATKNDGTKVTGNIASKSSSDLTVSGATVTAPAGYYANAASKAVSTTTHPNPTAAITSSTGVVTASHTQGTGYVTGGTTTGTLSLTTQASKTVIPTETAQTAVASYRWTTGPISVAAISSTYVGTGVTTRSAADMTVAGQSVTAPAGYYSSAVSKSIEEGSAFPPAVTITTAPTISVNTSGVVTANYTGSSSITPTVNAGYVTAGTAGTISTTGTSTYQLTSQAAATYYPSTADQTIASQRWLVGDQTIKSVTTSNLTAENIAEGVVVEVGDSGNASRITQITGTHSGSGSYTATIIGDGNNTHCYVMYNNIRYSNNSSTFTFKAGDSLTVYCRGDNVTINGENITLSNYSYIHTLSAGNIKILMGYDTSTSNDVELLESIQPTGTLSITENANYNVYGYSAVDVNVLAGEGYTVDQIAMRSISGSISGNATEIGSFAFYNCSNLTAVDFPKATNIHNSAFYKCVKLNAVSFSLATAIGFEAFYSCSSLTAINFPCVKSIWSSAFYGCFRLNTISFPLMTTITSNAFRFCYNLTTISLPSASVIGNYAFYSCSKLMSVYLLGSSQATLGGTSAFTYTPISTSSSGVYGSIFVPASLYSSYIAATNWSVYSARIVSV